MKTFSAVRFIAKAFVKTHVTAASHS